MQTNKFVIVGLMLVIAGIYIAALIFFAPLGYFGIKTTLEGNSDKKAVIYIDGLRAAEGEVYMSFVTPREYKIRIAHEGYQERNQTINVERFSVRNKPVYTFELKKLYSYDIRSDPPGANVYLDAFPLENVKTPTTLKDLKSGKHTVKLELEGYPPIAYTIDTAKDPVTMIFSFKQGMTVLFNTEPQGATINIDGKEMGVTPCRIDGLAAKEYLFEITLEGHETIKRFIDIGLAGSSLDLKLSKLPIIPVITDPPGLEIILDGKPAGKSPVLTYALPGKHIYKIGGRELNIEVKGDMVIHEIFESTKKELTFIAGDGKRYVATDTIGSFNLGLPNGTYQVCEKIKGGILRLGAVDWQGKPLKMPTLATGKKASISTFESNDPISLVIRADKDGKTLEHEELGFGKVELNLDMLEEKAGKHNSYTFEIGSGELKASLALSKAEIMAGFTYIVETSK